MFISGYENHCQFKTAVNLPQPVKQVSAVQGQILRYPPIHYEMGTFHNMRPGIHLAITSPIKCGGDTRK
ncbi:hypothetical protein I7I48_12078 [Histoplasma ohiense]|nr:hypothetical protein I7I48_12078 [Histoplasma ohiense (nom. inval.)]